ncbi:phage tail protein [Palleronia sp. LCG004]|uniref:phage tail protein n=1 Tax=Palleronia sp. LCG004 TaxID=3079304 RepID=UPI002943B560|nr:phage tail protein [Palleronia sp. LCG004]WOI54951.1 phage tail protein [Palleronia sp. LCG004]
MRFIALLAAVALFAQPAEAGPVVGALAAFSGWVTAGLASSGFGGVLTRLAVGVVTSRISMALGRRQQRPQGIRTQVTQTGGTNAQTMIFGWCATAGTFAAPPASWGKDNRQRVHVISLADVPIEALTRVFIDGEPVEYDDYVSETYGKLAGREALGRLDDRTWLTFHDGTQSVADPYLLDALGSDPDRPWRSDMVLPGVAYAHQTFRFDTEKYAGQPRSLFEVLGMRLYDPRLDSARGGSGGHRVDDPSTWSYTANPVVMIYNIIIGIRLPDGNVWGIGADPDDPVLSYFAAAMNACDEAVPVDGGGTRKRYRAGLEVGVDEEPLDVIDELLKACGGKIAEIGGRWVISVGAPPPATLHITDDDILVTDPREFEPFPGLAETYNAVSATYPDVDNAWEATEAVEWINPEWEAADGGRRLTAELRLDAVPFGRQVRALMRETGKDNRRFRSHVIPLAQEALGHNALDTISWTSKHNGYKAKLFEIERQVVDPETLASAFLVRERDPSDYDPDSAFDALLPVAPPRSIIEPEVPGVDGWGVRAFAIKGEGGEARRPAIELTWSADLVARAVAWRIVHLATGDVVSEGATSAVRSGRMVISDGLLPAETYGVIGEAVSDRRTRPEPQIVVTTPDARIGKADLVPQIVQQIELLDELGEHYEAGLVSYLDGLNAEIEGAVSDANTAVERSELLAESRDNLFLDPRFTKEGTIGLWSGANGTTGLVRAGTVAGATHGASYSGRATAAADGRVDVRYRGLAVSVGRTLRVGGWFRFTATTTLQMSARSAKSDGEYSNFTGIKSQVVPANTWTFVSGEGKVAGGAYCDEFAFVATGLPAGAYFSWTNAYLQDVTQEAEAKAFVRETTYAKAEADRQIASLRTEIRARYDTTIAGHDEQIVVLTNKQGAQAGQINTLFADFGNIESSVNSLGQTVANDREAFSQYKISANSRFKDVEAMAELVARTTVDSNGNSVALVRLAAGTSRNSAMLEVAAGSNWAALRFDGMSIFSGGLQSDNYSSNSAGWGIFRGGYAEFQNIKVRRQLQVATGAFYVNFATDNTPAITERGSWYVDTGFQVEAWRGSTRAYEAVAGLEGNVSVDYDSGRALNSFRWGWDVKVIYMTRGDGYASIVLKIQGSQANVQRVRGDLRWRLMEIT